MVAAGGKDACVRQRRDADAGSLGPGEMGGGHRAAAPDPALCRAKLRTMVSRPPAAPRREQKSHLVAGHLQQLFPPANRDRSDTGTRKARLRDRRSRSTAVLWAPTL